jgi:hypothetical protein
VLSVAANAGFSKNQIKTTLSPALAVDAAGATLAWASVVITDGFRPGDHLFADTSGKSIAADYDADTGVLTLTGTDTLARYQQALQTVCYWRTGQDADDYCAARRRDITWQVSDGIDWSLPRTTRLAITAVAAARANLLARFLLVGVHEGRAAFADGIG